MWDPDATEVLPRDPGRDLTSTRPLPRIDGTVQSPYPSGGPAGLRRGRVPRGVWAGAVLAACTAGGLAVGAMTAGSAEPTAGDPPPGPAESAAAAPPPGSASPTPSVPAPQPTGPVGYQVTVVTADVAGTGTDSDVQARLTDEAGRTSSWTVLDTSGHNDFESGARDTYVIPVPPGFGSPAAFQLWKSGEDAWAVQSDVSVTGPDGYSAVWHPAGEPPRLWITGGDPAPEDGAPVFTAYSPDGGLTRNTP
ncbi:PLAT/LH2 domain-containing protein [Streptomyces sp. NPDC000410]|uniref:PLAT/LH2 domain-containing protein n=1 Tax=Streptomyces sp. NPDC000410 TaxID=3154254 RepID=UPI00333219E4